MLIRKTPLCFLAVEMRKSIYRRNPIEKYFFKNYDINISFKLIRQRFRGYRCESGIAIFDRRVTLDYAFCPFEQVVKNDCLMLETHSLHNSQVTLKYGHARFTKLHLNLKNYLNLTISGIVSQSKMR